ncbi:MAG TPA: DUF4142 domain-containing protein [Moraxellaceae bacterium]
MNIKKYAVLVLGFGALLLAPLAMARLQDLEPHDASTDNQAGSKTASDERRDLLRRALAGGSLEVDAGWLAVKRSHDPGVIEFGRKMANSHNATNKQLIMIADKLGVSSSSPKLDEQRVERIEQLKSVDASSFDALYLKGQVAAHEELAAVFAAVARDESAPELAAFARERRDMVDTHLKEARELLEKLA